MCYQKMVCFGIFWGLTIQYFCQYFTSPLCIIYHNPRDHSTHMRVLENSSLVLTCTPELASWYCGLLLQQWYLLCKKGTMLLGPFILEQMLLELDCSFGRSPVVSQSCSKLSNLLSGLEHLQTLGGRRIGGFSFRGAFYLGWIV